MTYEEPLNPVAVEHAIRDTADRIVKGVRVVSDADQAAQDARREYDRAYAHAYLSHEGPAHEKKAAAELQTTVERATAERAEVTWRYARDQGKALYAQLDALRSIAVSVRTAYNTAGN